MSHAELGFQWGTVPAGWIVLAGIWVVVGICIWFIENIVIHFNQVCGFFCL